MYVLKNIEGEIVAAAKRMPTNTEGEPIEGWVVCDDQEALQIFLEAIEQS